MADITSLESRKADITSLQIEMQERITTQSQKMKYLFRWVVLLAVITIVAMVMLSVMQIGQHSINGMNIMHSRKIRWAFVL